MVEKTSNAEESAELRELRAQVRALQAELAQLREPRGRRRRPARAESRRAGEEREDKRREDEREISDTVRDIFDRGGEEASRLVRAITVGYLEHVNLWANELGDFTRRVNARNHPDPDETPDDVARRLPREVTSELLESVRRSFDFPQRAVDRAHQSYDETEELPTRGVRRESHREDGAVETAKTP